MMTKDLYQKVTENLQQNDRADPGRVEERAGTESCHDRVRLRGHSAPFCPLHTPRKKVIITSTAATQRTALSVRLIVNVPPFVPDLFGLAPLLLDGQIGQHVRRCIAVMLILATPFAVGFHMDSPWKR